MMRYTGTCYIGVVGGQRSTVESFVNTSRIDTQPGDYGPFFKWATKGYEVRQSHLNHWMDETEHAFMMLLDGDMVFEQNTLEKLREHELPYVSGYYLRRRNPTYSVWFEPWYDPETGDIGDYPARPFFRVPERGALHPLGGSGWGCVLIHRDVVMATREVLKGEMEIIEDDMDVWPYDLDAVACGEEIIRPLTCQRKPVGSDIRFPFYAAAAGYQLLGDPEVRPRHEMTHFLHPDEYDNSMTPEGVDNASQAWMEKYGIPKRKAFDEARKQWRESVL